MVTLSEIIVKWTIPWCENGVIAVIWIRCNNHFSPRVSNSTPPSHPPHPWKILQFVRGGFVFLYLLNHLSCQIPWWADGGPVSELTKGRLAHPHFLSLLTSLLVTRKRTELVEDTHRGSKRRGRNPWIGCSLWSCRENNLCTLGWQEASWQSIRFDEKQFEQRTKWQEFLIQIMACCPHALTVPWEMCLWSQDNYRHATDMSIGSSLPRRGFVYKEPSRVQSKGQII